MRDPARINRIVEKLLAFWLEYPDFRLTQLVASAAALGSLNEDSQENFDPYHVEDDIVEVGLDKLNGL